MPELRRHREHPNSAREELLPELKLLSDWAIQGGLVDAAIGWSGFPRRTAGCVLADLLRRNDKKILAEYNELWDKVWWNRHQVWLEKIESGEEPLREGQKEILEQAKRAA